MGHLSLNGLVDSVRASAPRLGDTTLVLIDGPAGSGKTTLAARLATALGGEPSAGAGTAHPDRPVPAASPVQTLHADDMYEGWDGLHALDDVLVGDVLAPLSRGHVGGFRMWDWVQGRRTHRIEVPPRSVLIIEGVGVGRRSARAFASALWWVEAPAPVRLARGLQRDGEGMREEWLAWQHTEHEHFTKDGTRAAADLVIDGTAALLP